LIFTVAPFNGSATEKQYVFVSKIATLGWGFFAIGVAELANRMGSLIEACNILGSLFYGNILGIFLIAFFFKRIKGDAVFTAAIITEAVVILLYRMDAVAFLWLNMIGCVGCHIHCRSSSAVSLQQNRY
jgi:hypothetical protein